MCASLYYMMITSTDSLIIIWFIWNGIAFYYFTHNWIVNEEKCKYRYFVGQRRWWQCLDIDTSGLLSWGAMATQQMDAIPNMCVCAEILPIIERVSQNVPNPSTKLFRIYFICMHLTVVHYIQVSTKVVSTNLCEECMMQNETNWMTFCCKETRKDWTIIEKCKRKHKTMHGIAVFFSFILTASRCNIHESTFKLQCLALANLVSLSRSLVWVCNFFYWRSSS